MGDLGGTQMRYDITPKGVVVATVQIDGHYETVVHPQPGETSIHARSTTDRDEASHLHENIWQACLQEDYEKI